MEILMAGWQNDGWLLSNMMNKMIIQGDINNSNSKKRGQSSIMRYMTNRSLRLDTFPKFNLVLEKLSGLRP